ncbi:MAG: chemotaxis response regulator protein-glutamate methylesterase [Armatimonadetes bacterium]|nr:chemotaxis response regulator protein-glutamate methylesterase [Armatimonadota bacterium]
MKPCRVLVVDDSALVRTLLTSILSREPDLEVVGTASDTVSARRKILELDPDVLTLDIEMPGTDGLTFLKKLMQLRPMPVVMVSQYTLANSEAAVRALELGAVDCVAKPAMDVSGRLSEIGDELVSKIRSAARVNRHALGTHPVPKRSGTTFGDERPRLCSGCLIAVGASVGGPVVVPRLLSDLPRWSPPVLLVQHMAAAFTASFVRRLAQHAPMNVCEASPGLEVLPGTVYVAPGDRHLKVVSAEGGAVCELVDGERVQGHRPSVDVLFRSVLEVAGIRTIGVLLTGMGEDGARALKQIRDAGGTTVAQDEASSVVWGMPGAAVAMGAAQHVWPLEEIGPRLISLFAPRQC